MDARTEVVREVFYTIRCFMFSWLSNEDNAGNQLGGPGKVVCVDESHFTRRKHHRAGPGGRATQGHEVVCPRHARTGLCHAQSRPAGRD